MVRDRKFLPKQQKFYWTVNTGLIIPEQAGVFHALQGEQQQ